MLEAHFGIPMAGAVICALNVRLDASTLAFILRHSEAKILLANRQFADLARQAVAMTRISLEVIGIDDPEAPEGEIADWTEYESLLETEDAADGIVWPDDEWDSIALNYTSGTTGNPKGAVYHHRGTYLNSLGQLLTFGIGSAPVYLWTLPMFHCNGWCFAWAIAAAGGTHVCLRRGGGRYHLRCHIPARRDAHVLRPDGSEFRGRRR
jgi:fatty-acyl-CoA synthase